MLDLNGRIAVVTGGAAGIGAAAAAHLRAAGAIAVSWDRTGGDIACDVADPLSIDAAIAATVERFGVPSLLVASAGVSSHGAILDLDPAEWDRTHDINLRGVMLTMQAVARKMIAHGLDGAMILVSSINSIVAEPGIATYSAAKAGVNHLARVAAREFGPHGIRVNVVGPGPTATQMLTGALENPAFRAEVLKRTPLGDVGTPDRIAEAIVGLMKLEWITGQAIMVDGGATLTTARSNWQAPDIEGRQAPA